MGLIKSANLPASLSPFSMRDIETQAQAMLARARHQAEALLAAAQTEAEELKQAAYAQALADGHRAGVKEGTEQGIAMGRDAALAEQRDRLTEILASLSTAVTDLDARRIQLESAALEEVVGLAIAVARRVTKRQGMLDPQVLIENLQAAMKLVVRCADVRVAIHPTQRQTLEDVLPRLRLQWPQLKHIELIDDPSLAPGGCRIFTAHGQVDGDLAGQLDRVVADLLPGGAEVASS